MSTVRVDQYICDCCKKTVMKPASSTLPIGWVYVSINPDAGSLSETLSMRADACSLTCAAGILRAHADKISASLPQVSQPPA